MIADLSGIEQKVRIHLRDIFADHWSGWWVKNEDRVPADMQKSVSEAVEKMLGCGDPKNGYTKYRCVSCEEHPERIVAFT